MAKTSVGATHPKPAVLRTTEEGPVAAIAGLNLEDAGSGIVILFVATGAASIEVWWSAGSTSAGLRTR